MLIFKSFLRKKTTKTYLVIYTIILATLFILLITKNIMVKLENNNYNGSFIEIENNNININNLNNIDKVYQAISIKDDYNKIFLISDNNYNLNDNEIIIPLKYKKEIKIGDVFELEIGDNNYNFTIKNYSNSKNDNILIVSPNIMNENKSLNNCYVLTLKNWLKKEKTLNEIRDKYKDSDISYYFYTSNDSYTTFIMIINILLSVLALLFTIILVVTCFNIIEDEKKKNEIYYKLGYLKVSLKKYNIIKITLLIGLSLIFSFIITTILYILYNFIK